MADSRRHRKDDVYRTAARHVAQKIRVALLRAPLSGRTVDGLSAEAQGLDVLAEDVRAFAQECAQQSLTHILPGLPSPEFRLADNIPEVGGQNIGLRAQTLDAGSAHIKQRGRFSE